MRETGRTLQAFFDEMVIFISFSSLNCTVSIQLIKIKRVFFFNFVHYKKNEIKKCVLIFYFQFNVRNVATQRIETVLR